jgi:hypothetical protein
MKNQTFHKTALYCSLVIMIVLAAQVWAQPSSTRGARGRGIYGDWQVKIEFGERQMESILSFSRDSEGNLTGQWISFFGVNDLKDVKFEDNKLSFVQSMRFGDNEFTQNFAGTVEDGKITGVLTSDRGESKLEGQRSQRMSRAVGNWELKYKFGDREMTTTLAIKPGKEEGELMGEWQSRRGESKISDLQYERGKLTFKREGNYQGQQFESTFEGTIQRGALTGMIKSERGEVPVEGTLIGAPLIGTWNLDIESEQGARKQRLVVNPDMSGLYGAIPLKKVDLEGDKVSFKTVLKFGDREFEMSFQGKMADSKLTGELTTSRGTQKITGTKVVRTFPRRSSQ